MVSTLERFPAVISILVGDSVKKRNTLTVLHEVAELLVPHSPIRGAVVLHYPLDLVTREVGQLATAQ